MIPAHLARHHSLHLLVLCCHGVCTASKAAKLELELWPYCLHDPVGCSNSALARHPDREPDFTRYRWSHVFKPSLSSLTASYGQCGTAVEKQHYPAVTRMPFTHNWVDSKLRQLIREDNLPERETTPLRRFWVDPTHRQKAVCQLVTGSWEAETTFSDKPGVCTTPLCIVWSTPSTAVSSSHQQQHDTQHAWVPGGSPSQAAQEVAEQRGLGNIIA